MQCLYVAENMTKCLLKRGVHQREVSVSEGWTIQRRENMTDELFSQ